MRATNRRRRMEVIRRVVPKPDGWKMGANGRVVVDLFRTLIPY